MKNSNEIVHSSTLFEFGNVVRVLLYPRSMPWRLLASASMHGCTHDPVLAQCMLWFSDTYHMMHAQTQLRELHSFSANISLTILDFCYHSYNTTDRNNNNFLFCFVVPQFRKYFINTVDHLIRKCLSCTYAFVKILNSDLCLQDKKKKSIVFSR